MCFLHVLNWWELTGQNIHSNSASNCNLCSSSPSLTVQHCGNHGAMSTNATLNAFYGLCADLTGGSALMWRYHHQVSHHIHCNDEAFDEDVFSGELCSYNV